MKKMVGDGGSGRARKGCIKSTRGPWIVRTKTKTGKVIPKLRYPSETERVRNLERERKRRAITRKIFAGLRQHGNYNLPKHADSNDLLMALCEEAGWHVRSDGTIYRKPLVPDKPNLVEAELMRQQKVEDGEAEEDTEYCTCSCNFDLNPSAIPLFGSFMNYRVF